MELIKREVPDNFNIFNIGDQHIGSMMYHSDGWYQTVDMIHSEYKGVSHNIVVDHGDAIEAIKTDDPRFSMATTIEGNVLQQAEMAKRVRTVIRDQIAVILTGNHEMKLHRFGDITNRLICKPLKVPFGTYSCKIEYHDKFGTIMKQFAAHGWGSIGSTADDEIRREANMKLSLKRKLKKKAGDTALMTMGHCHKLIVAEPVKTLFLTDDSEKIIQNHTKNINLGEYIHPDHRWYANTGSYLKLYGDMGVSGYAEIAGYDPTILGFVIARVRNRELVDVDKIPT